MMKPILFNTEMVKAILEGKKTVTRRVIKKQPRSDCHADFPSELKDRPTRYFDTGGNAWACAVCGWGIGPDGNSLYKSPYVPGDILYVRETFATITDLFGEFPQFAYKADWQGPEGKWKPSIHMPKEAARIFLKVISVKLERLQDITIKQVLKEGVYSEFNNYFKTENTKFLFDKFKNLWDSTIKKQDIEKYGCEANPYVWVIEFERCEKPKGESINDAR